MQNLNCIFLGSFLYPYGYAATKRKQQFLDYLLLQNVNLKVFITHKLARGSEINDNKGVFNGIPYEVITPRFKKNLFSLIFFPFLILKTCFLIVKHRKRDLKNIIVTFGINIEIILPLFFAKLLGFKIVFDIVEDFSIFNFGRSKVNLLKNWIIRILPNYFIMYLADGLSFVSVYLKNKYINCKKKSIPIELVPVSASNLSFNQENKKKGESFNLLYSGTYGQKDGLLVLLTSVNKFIKTNNNAKLILTGMCPDHIKLQVKAIFGNLDNIVFTGRLEDQQYYETLASSDVMLMTRNGSDIANSGFPFKLGEYLASCKPVICTKVSDVELYLKDKESAYLISPDSSDELFEALMCIFNNQQKAKDVGLKGREMALKYFNPTINSKKFYSILLRC